MGNLKILGIGNALMDILVLPEDDQIINGLDLPKGGMICPKNTYFDCNEYMVNTNFCEIFMTLPIQSGDR